MAAYVVVLDACHVGLGPQLQVPGDDAFGQLGVQGRPLGAGLAALEAEAALLTGRAAVAILAVDRHVTGVAGVAHLLGAGVHHLEVVVARQPLVVVGAGHAHALLGAIVVG